MNGYRLFGWQVNRGLQRLPDFYRADQFYKELGAARRHGAAAAGGQPRRGLAAGVGHSQGSASMKSCRRKSPPRRGSRSSRPLPESGSARTAPAVQARIAVPAGCKLLDAKAFANGVTAASRKLVSERPTDDGRRRSTSGNCRCPATPGSDRGRRRNGLADGGLRQRDCRTRTAPVVPRRTPEIYVVALGIDRYRDPEITALDLSGRRCPGGRQLLQTRTAGLYKCGEVRLLVNDEVTPATWKKAIGELRDKLKDRVEADDLLVFFLAGHGIVDEKTQKYYFVGHDFTLADLARGLQELHWLGRFRLLADVPCRKVALLDTCHSGAIQPLRTRDLKTAVRELQADVVFTVTASTGEQLAAESATGGMACSPVACWMPWRARSSGEQACRSSELGLLPLGVVTLDEVVSYVKQIGAQATKADRHPRPAPDDVLVPFTAIP